MAYFNNKIVLRTVRPVSVMKQLEYRVFLFKPSWALKLVQYTFFSLRYFTLRSTSAHVSDTEPMSVDSRLTLVH